MRPRPRPSKPGRRRTAGITPELQIANTIQQDLSTCWPCRDSTRESYSALINAALWWLPLLRRGHLLKNLLAAGAVATFVPRRRDFLPSAVRTPPCPRRRWHQPRYVRMNALQRPFGMLCGNPNWLGRHQLSAQSSLAVAGISWGVPLCQAAAPDEGPEHRHDAS